MTPEELPIEPAVAALDAVVRPPGSKSITNRALVCAALADGRSRLTGVLDSEDTRVMVDCLTRMGVAVESDWPGAEAVVSGCGGQIPAPGAELYTANSGTTMRFLTGMAALGRGRFVLDGVARMRQRPIDDLLQALAQTGVQARSVAGNGCPPVEILSAGLPGGTARLRGDVSSQFLSGLLLSAPYAQADLRITVDGVLVSQPYVRMTLAVMHAFGAAAQETGPAEYFVPGGQRYKARHYAIEPDASAASYFWAAAAIAGGRVTVQGLTRDSLQGDVRFVECLERMGCRVEHLPEGIAVIGGPLRGIDVDMNDISDTVQTLSAVALFAAGPTRMSNIGHIRHKETDRIAALATELRKCGARVEETPDALTVHPAPLRGAVLDTYHDHRMAMSLALVGLRQRGIVIRDPGCTVKTYPRFFADLQRVCNGR